YRFQEGRVIAGIAFPGGALCDAQRCIRRAGSLHFGVKFDLIHRQGVAPRMAQEPSAAVERQRRKLLILENDRVLRRELEEIFADLEVPSADTSEQALVLLRRIEPDVVLFDLGAAREPAVAAQSLDLLRQILNLAPDTKIIAMTEHDARELAVAAVGLG